MSINNSRWICFQIGAREHYAIPRALARRGLLGSLVTDVWTTPDATLGKIPGRTGAIMRSRFETELVNADVHAFNKSFLVFEAAARLQRKSGWQTVIERNDWFQKHAVNTLRMLLDKPAKSNPQGPDSHSTKKTPEGKLNAVDALHKDERNSTVPPVVFAYSYAAKEIFAEARRHGCKTVLGQIDPGPEEIKLVNRIEAEHGAPLTVRPPTEYRERWRDECDLADLILVNSEWSKELVVGGGLSDEKIVVVPLAYQTPGNSNSTTVSREPVPDSFDTTRPLRMLYLGQVIARKGVIELAAAIDSLSDRPVHWTIVGGGDTVLMQRLAGCQNVEVIGQVERESAVEYYRDADVFILPTHSDGFAITLLEAAAFGLPIVASPFCGDVVRHGVDGLVLPDVSEGSIVSGIDTLLGRSVVRGMNEQERTLRTIDDLADDLLTINHEID